MKNDVWMPIVIGDYLGDTQRLTTEQHGAYLLLLMDYWRNGPPPLDDQILCSISRLKPARFRKHKSTLLGFFQVVDGRLVSKRADEEKVRAEQNARRNSERARKAADARWHPGEGDAPSNAPSNASSNAPECPSPSPYSLPKGKGGQAAEDPVKKLIDEGVALLTSAGSTEPAARSLIGKWRKDHGNAATDSALAEAVRLQVAEPRAWITARLKKQANDSDGLMAAIDRTYGREAA